jgi:hypothetical protein
MDIARLLELGFVSSAGDTETWSGEIDYRTDTNTYNLEVTNTKGEKVWCVVEQNPGHGKWVVDIIGWDMVGVKDTGDVMGWVERVKCGALLIDA